MRSISAPLDAHIQQEVTTLATCVKIVRPDGQEFYLTDSDRDILFGGNTYLASTPYDRSVIESNAALTADNFEVTGLLDNDVLKATELKAGLFDYSEVYLFLVNWADLSQGALKQKRGRLGEISLIRGDLFRVEIDGMTKDLHQVIGELYSPECRASLGDIRCQVPLIIPVVQRNTAYAVGDRVRVGADIVEPPIELPLVNGSFETGDLTGWTGTGSVTTNPGGGLTAKEGTYLYYAGIASTRQITQTVDISGVLDTAKIDAEAYQFSFSGWLANNAASDTVGLKVEYLDVSDVVLSTPMNTGQSAISPILTWVEYAMNAPVPANTRKIRVTINMTRVAGTALNCCADNLYGEFLEVKPYGELMYLCTVAGMTAASEPEYPINEGDNVVDGTATFEAEQSWTMYKGVETIIDRRTFTISEVHDARVVDDWFNFGAVKFLDGANAGKTVQIKGWTAATRTVELMFPAPFDIDSSTIRIYPGCDRRLATCKDKFDNVLNYRGEPYVPGSDFLTRFPDAH